MHLPIPDRLCHDILDYPGVVGMAKTASDAGRPVVVVKFAHERHKARCEAEDGLPRQYGDVGIRFEVSGQPTPLAALAEPRPLADRRDRFRPVPAGVSAAHVSVTAGSTSWLLSDGSTLYMASNRHIFAPLGKGVERGDPIIQPGFIDGGSDPKDTVAHLSGYVSPVDGYSADVAWAEPTDESIPTNDILEAPQPANPKVEPRVGMNVWKSGRTTGITNGPIRETELILDNVAGARMERQFTTDALSQGGDSGSPFFAQSGSESNPVGMLWGAFIKSDGTFQSSIGFPVSAVEEQTGMSVIVPQEGFGGVSRGALVVGGIAAAAYLSQR